MLVTNPPPPNFAFVGSCTLSEYLPSRWGLNGHFCCVHRSRDSQCLSMGRIPPKLPLSVGISTPHLIHSSSADVSHPQTASRSVLPYFQSCEPSSFIRNNSAEFFYRLLICPTDRHTDKETTLRLTLAATCSPTMHVMWLKIPTF